MAQSIWGAGQSSTTDALSLLGFLLLLRHIQPENYSAIHRQSIEGNV